MPRSPTELSRIGEEEASEDKAGEEQEECFELEDTALVAGATNNSNNDNNNTPPEQQQQQQQLDETRSTVLDMSAYNNTTDPRASLPDSPTLPCVALNPPPPPLLSLSPPEVWKGGRTLAARRRKNNRSSSTPSFTLSKPLAGMGDSLNWKLSVLHRFNAIRYPL